MYPLLRARCRLNHHVSPIISNVSQIKYRFGIFLHSKFGLISDKSTPPLLTFASSSGLKFVIEQIMSSFLKEGDHEVVEDFCWFSMNFSSFFVISLGVIFKIPLASPSPFKKGDKFFFVKYSASQALQLKMAGPDNHRWVNKIFHWFS